MTAVALGDVYAKYGKRVADIIGSLTLLIVFAPVAGGIAAAIRLKHGPPILFHQERCGMNGHAFQLHKFRTMVNGTEQLANNYPAPDMVTAVGRLLRRYSLDEIPQLFNILVGEMTFVGPRPALLPQVERYTERQRERLAVLPGLTGLAQVRHRNNAPWSVRIDSDLEYVHHMSPGLDFRILLATLPKALFGEDQIVGQTVDDVDDLGSPREQVPQ